MRNPALHKSQNGFALVSALFVLVVLALLGAAMVIMSGTHSSTPVSALEGARAYHAARSGMEWGIHQALSDDTWCDTGITTDFNLDSFDIQVTCESPSTFKEGGTEYRIYQITTTADTGTFGEPGYASRRMEAKIIEKIETP